MKFFAYFCFALGLLVLLGGLAYGFAMLVGPTFMIIASLVLAAFVIACEIYADVTTQPNHTTIEHRS
jgi:hypothetical protein